MCILENNKSKYTFLICKSSRDEDDDADIARNRYA